MDRNSNSPVPRQATGAGARRQAASGGCLAQVGVGYRLAQVTALLAPVTDTPRLEAEILLSHVLGVSRTALLAHPEWWLSAEQDADFRRLVQRRATAYPLPYLTGRSEFYGLEFEVTPDVLIPRPDTETLVDLALARNPAKVIDAGTGSGNIAVSIAVHLPQVLLTAIDLSPEALAVARRNAVRHGASDRIRFDVGDLLAGCAGAGADLVVSNPPYVASPAEWDALPASVRDYEPRLALDGGRDGLDVLRRLLAQAPAALRPGAAVLAEIGATQGQAALALAATQFPRATVCVHKDLAGRDRVLEVQT